MVLPMAQFQVCRASTKSISTPESQSRQQSQRPSPTHRPYVGRGNSSCCLIDSRAFGSPQMIFSEFPEWYFLLRRTVGLATAIRDIRCRAACRRRSRRRGASILRWTRIEHHRFPTKRKSIVDLLQPIVACRASWRTLSYHAVYTEQVDHIIPLNGNTVCRPPRITDGALIRIVLATHGAGL